MGLKLAADFFPLLDFTYLDFALQPGKYSEKSILQI
jgi:hypothetical protein